MCQMRIVLDRGGKEEVIMTNATLLEKNRAGVVVSALFEDPKQVDGVFVKRIDFTKGTVLLEREPSA